MSASIIFAPINIDWWHSGTAYPGCLGKWPLNVFLIYARCFIINGFPRLLSQNV